MRLGARKPEYALPTSDILVSISSHYDRYKSILSETPGFQTWYEKFRAEGLNPEAAKLRAGEQLKKHFESTARSIHRLQPTLSAADVAYEAASLLFDELHQGFDLEALRDTAPFPLDKGIPLLIALEYRMNRGLLKIRRQTSRVR